MDKQVRGEKPINKNIIGKNQINKNQFTKKTRDMENTFTLHIFGYGETQINSKEFSFKTKTSPLKKVKAVIDMLYAMKPEGNEAKEEYHNITFFGFGKARFMSDKSFDVAVTPELNAAVTLLIAELKSEFDKLEKK